MTDNCVQGLTEMSTPYNRAYRYLDTDDDRRELVADIARTRQSVIHLAETVPSNRRFEPRYHSWSLAGLLAHLHNHDNLALVWIQLALLNVRPPFPLALLNWTNERAASFFRRRLVETTLRDIQQNELRVASFILRLPIDKFSKQVYVPALESYMTVERALQEFFLFHWQEHLLTMQKVEGIFYEPPERFDTL